MELGPFDYENENITRSLWIAEGFTDYYADLQVARAGLQTRDEYLEELSNTIELLQTTPGRLVQSAEMASLRRVDQVLPARRELEQQRRSATTPRARSSRSCSTRRFARRPAARNRSTT